MRRLLAPLVLAACVAFGAGAAAISSNVPPRVEVHAERAQAAYAWRDHDYERLRRCRTELTWADRIGHPLIWSDTLPDHSDVPGMHAPRSPPPLPASTRFESFFNRTARHAARDGRTVGSPGIACTPLTLYAPFCREWIPWSGGTFTEAELPGAGTIASTSTCGGLVSSLTPVTVSTTSAMNTQMGLGCKNIVIQAGASIAMVNVSCTDCEITIPATSSLAWVVNPFRSGPGSHRVRIRGPGTFGGMQFLPPGTGQSNPSDIIVDGVKLAPNAATSGSVGPFFSIDTHVDRFITMHTVAITPATSDPTPVGNGWIGEASDWGIFDVSAATNTTEGATNSWLIRNTNGSARRILADSMLHAYSTQQAIYRQGSGTTPGNANALIRNSVLWKEDGLIAKDEDPAYLNVGLWADHNTFIIGAGLSNFLGRQDQAGSGGDTSQVILTNTDWRAPSSSNVNASTLTSLESVTKNVHMTAGNTYTYGTPLSTLVPAWPDRTSPLTGSTLDGNPAHLPSAQ